MTIATTYSCAGSALKRGDLIGLFGGIIPAGFNPESFTVRDLASALPERPPQRHIVHLENVLLHFSICRSDLAPLLASGNQRVWAEALRYLSTQRR